MKFKKLFIYEYKNIKNLDIDFDRTDGLSIIVGNNGTGKSNILECLSEIFDSLYNGKRTEIKFELVYEINNNIVEIKNKLKLVVRVNNKLISLHNMLKKNLLPTNIITMYSGEDDRLYKNYYMNNEKNEYSKLIYIDKRMWKIALVTLISSKLPNTLKFLKEELNINKVNNIVFLYIRKVHFFAFCII